MSQPQDLLLCEKRDLIATVTLNRPAQRNALSVALVERLHAVWASVDADPEVRVVILTAAECGTFCAGMDLKRFLAGEKAHVPGRGFGGLVEHPPRKPLIAAVEGWALGGGFELVLACDLVVAAHGARFGLPEVTRGLIARAGGAVRLPRRLPRAIALELLLTGAPLTAERAERYGLVNRVVPDGQALDAALELAAGIAGNAPLAVAAAKSLAVDSADWPEAELFTRQAHYTEAVFASADAQEGARAFAEQRAPRWTGS